MLISYVSAVAETDAGGLLGLVGGLFAHKKNHPDPAPVYVHPAPAPVHQAPGEHKAAKHMYSLQLQNHHSIRKHFIKITFHSLATIKAMYIGSICIYHHCRGDAML